MAAWIYWADPRSGRDIHLTPGLSSGRLDQRIWAAIDGAVVTGEHLADPYSLALRFPPQVDPDVWEGLSVDEEVGRVEVGDLPTGRRVLRIDVVAQLMHTDQGAVGDPLAVSIWIHGELAEVWLTPRELTMHQFHRGPVHLSLLARFGEEFTADVTTWLPPDVVLLGEETFVHAVGEEVPLVEWSATGHVTVDQTSGALVATTPGAGTVTAAVRAVLGQPAVPEATATVDVVSPWALPRLTDFIGGAGPALVEQVPNILFLPDGFLAEDEALFRGVMDELVATLTREPALEPFGLLVDRVNYWLAWEPSRQRGTSVLTEGMLDREDRFSRADDRAGVAGAHAEIGREDHGEDQVALNENDTAFHVVSGERRRARTAGVQRAMAMNADRIRPLDFDDLLGALTHPQAGEIGQRWVTGRADQSNVVLVCLSALWGGSVSVRRGQAVQAAVSLGRAWVAPIREAEYGLDLGYDAPPAVTSRLDLASLVAHELGHCWGLGDEYAEEGVQEASLGYANLNTRAEVSDPGTGRLDGSLVRWAWSRLRAAAVLAADPVPSQEPLDPGDSSWQPGRVLLEVGTLQADPFAVGDLVQVRTRPLLDSATSSEHRVTAIDRWAEVDAVELEPVAGSSDLLEPAGRVLFEAGSVLILPRTDGTGSVTGELPVMHPAVREHLTATSNPLNARRHAQDNRPCDESDPREAPLLARNLPPGLDLPKGVPSWRLVGLVEGGGRLACGVYHPAGGCMMNSRMGRDGRRSQAVAIPYCPVCRYAIIDRLQPALHAAIDDLYDAIYPVLDETGGP